MIALSRDFEGRIKIKQGYFVGYLSECVFTDRAREYQLSSTRTSTNIAVFISNCPISIELLIFQTLYTFFISLRDLQVQREARDRQDIRE